MLVHGLLPEAPGLCKDPCLDFLEEVGFAVAQEGKGDSYVTDTRLLG